LNAIQAEAAASPTVGQTDHRVADVDGFSETRITAKPFDFLM